MKPAHTPGLMCHHGFLHCLLLNLLLISCFQRTSKRRKVSAVTEESEAAERPKRRKVAKKTGTAVHWSRETSERLRLLIITRVVFFFFFVVSLQLMQ